MRAEASRRERGAREPRHGGRVLYVSGVDGGRERGGDADSECDARGAGGIAPAVYFALIVRLMWKVCQCVMHVNVYTRARRYGRALTERCADRANQFRLSHLRYLGPGRSLPSPS